MVLVGKIEMLIKIRFFGIQTNSSKSFIENGIRFRIENVIVARSII